MQKKSLIFIFFVMILLTVSCSKKMADASEGKTHSTSVTTTEQVDLINPNPENANLIFKYDLAKSTHQYLLKKYKTIFSEKNNNLVILDLQGNTKSFITNKGEVQDSWNDHEKETYYSSPEFILAAYYEQQHYALLLDTRYMGESWNVLLVDLNNNFEEKYLEGWPHFSTTQPKLVAYNMDIYAGFSNNGLGVYSYGKDYKLKQEYVLSPENWGPHTAEWMSNTEILIQANHLCDNNEECSEQKKLLLVDDHWVLQENSLPNSSFNVDSNVNMRNDAASSSSSSSKNIEGTETPDSKNSH